MVQKDVHVAITGASSGIGAAFAKAWAARGARVTLVARRRELLAEVAAAAGGKTQVFAADLGALAKCDAWLAPAEEAFGPVDVLVNNAGVQIVDEFAHTDEERARAMIELDLLVPLHLTRKVLPAMLARKAGTIVDVASMAAIAPPPGMVYYNAAKGGLAAASESLRGELRGTGVHVVTVYPGAIDTPMADAAYVALEKNLGVKLVPKGSPETLAAKVVRAVEKRKKRVIYPGSQRLARHFPNLTRFLLDRLSPKVVSGQTRKG